MKEIDATRIKLQCLEMVEGTELKWWKVIRQSPSSLFDRPPLFQRDKEKYELALGIIEGKPVWKGDHYFLRDIQCQANFSDAPSQIYWDKCTWNPPKPKIIPVELPLETVEFMARENHYNFPHYEVLFSACRDTLEKQKNQSTHGGSITGRIDIGVTTK